MKTIKLKDSMISITVKDDKDFDYELVTEEVHYN